MPLLIACLSLLLCFMLFAIVLQLMKQQGRLLLRLDEIEEQVGLAGGATARIPARSGVAPATQPQGLPVGTPFSPFSLPDLDGKIVSLSDFAGKKTLVVNWSPHCGFCDMAATDLAAVQPDLGANDIAIVLLAYGDAEANRDLIKEHSLECAVLLRDDESQPIKEFESFGTPVAYLLDENGVIADSIAVGANKVPELARRAASHGQPGAGIRKRSVADSKIEREGLSVGTPAPDFTLPAIRGGDISLGDYRGTKVLLVFSDPNCGPCTELLPLLNERHRSRSESDPAIIMVGRGDPEENRKKAEEHNLEFPVVLQNRWKLSKEYGIFATPVAFLIDEHGVIEREVAKGVERILGLLSPIVAAQA